MTTNKLFVLICVLLNIQIYSCNNDLHPVNNLHWTINKLPVVFYSDVTLSCIVPASLPCCENTRKWKGGRSQKLLLFNGSSTKSSKYREEIKQNGFDLVIKDFSKEDMHVNYSCSYGFFSFSKNLTIEENSYKIEPRNKTVDLRYDINTGKVAVTVRIEEVYPVPQCRAVFMGVNISANVNVSDVEFRLSYQISVFTTFILNTEKCYGKFKLICQDRFDDYLLVDEDSHNICKSTKIGTGENSGFQCCCCSILILHVTIFSFYQFMFFESKLL